MIVYPAYIYMGKKPFDISKYAFLGYKDNYYMASWASLANNALISLDEGLYRVNMQTASAPRFDINQILGSNLILSAKCSDSFSETARPLTISWFGAGDIVIGRTSVTPTKDYTLQTFPVPENTLKIKITHNDPTKTPIYLDMVHFE